MELKIDYITEDEITDIFSRYLEGKGWEIVSRAMGHSRGADIVAKRNGKIFCVEAKGGGSQTKGTNRFGKPFTRLQCQIHTDAAFASLPRMMSRYSPDFVGLILPDDPHHKESVSEIFLAIKKLEAGIWLINRDNVTSLFDPTDQ